MTSQISDKRTYPWLKFAHIFHRLENKVMNAVIWAESLSTRLSEDTATVAATLHLGAWALCLANYSVLTSTLGVNLVCNIGFGPDATHTTTDVSRSHI